MNDLQINQIEVSLEELRRTYPEIKKIFEKAIHGEFINANSSTPGESSLYKTIVNNTNLIKQYFMIIGYELRLEKGYCYFLATIESENDETANLQDRKEIKGLVGCMSAFALLKNVNNNFGLIDGFEFTLSTIEMEIANDPIYDTIIPMRSNGDDSYRKYIEKLISLLKLHGYIEEVSKKEKRYKTLNSFSYLVERVDNLEIIGEEDE